MRRAAKRDKTEPAIIAAIERTGWFVVRLSDPGVPDLLCVRRGVVRLLEVKTGSNGLTEAQQALHVRLLANGCRVHVVRTPEEALASLSEDSGRTCAPPRPV